MRLIVVSTAVLLLAGPVIAAERSKSREEKKQEEIRKATRTLAGFDRSDPDQAFIRDRAQELLLRAERAAAGSYLFERLIEAVDDLLDAGKELAKAARRGGDSEKQPDAGDTARYLERTYFRVTQADYYSRISADPNGPEYIKMARRLYQAARREYDGKNYQRARRLAGAAGELVSTLENLAQAAVRVPDPPKLED
jgi:hypothetical protein